MSTYVYDADIVWDANVPWNGEVVAQSTVVPRFQGRGPREQPITQHLYLNVGSVAVNKQPISIESKPVRHMSSEYKHHIPVIDLTNVKIGQPTYDIIIESMKIVTVK